MTNMRQTSIEHEIVIVTIIAIFLGSRTIYLVGLLMLFTLRVSLHVKVQDDGLGLFYFYFSFLFYFIIYFLILDLGVGL